MLAHSFYRKTGCTDVKFLNVSESIRIFISESEQNFGFPHIPSEYNCVSRCLGGSSEEDCVGALAANHHNQRRSAQTNLKVPVRRSDSDLLVRG